MLDRPASPTTPSAPEGAPLPARGALESVEIWSGGARGPLLERLASVPRSGRPAPKPSEQLVERVSAERSPLIVRPQADGAGPTLAIPVFDGNELRSIAVLRWNADIVGAIELWAPLSTRDALGLHSGYYGKLSAFQRLSALTQFEPGVGLPGGCWASRRPLLYPELSRSSAFIRAAAARTEGLQWGVAYPVLRRNEITHVVTLLFRRTSPKALGAEVWLGSAGTATVARGLALNEAELGDASNAASASLATRAVAERLALSVAASPNDDRELVALPVLSDTPAVVVLDP